MSRRSSLDTHSVTRSRHSRPSSASGDLLAGNGDGAPPVSCHFRYTGCYLLVIISDGCDMLRQETIGRQLYGFGEHPNTTGSNGTSGDSEAAATDTPPSRQEIDEFNAQWSDRFIGETIQQIAKGKWQIFSIFLIGVRLKSSTEYKS